MAKRKRLTPANPMFLGADAPEPATSASAPLPGPMVGRPLAAHRAPIADVAADSSASAALAEVAGELAEARASGRMVLRLPLSAIEQGHLVRDRLPVMDEDMEALLTSLRERGQQTPIEVTALGAGRYGLISGWRRCQALAQLAATGAGDGHVLALERRPDTAPAAYRAMVEENEIRAGLSHFERARIVHVAVEQGVFASHREALQGLFGAASRPRRSKIGSFVSVVQALGDALRFPRSIGERLGLRLAKALEADPALGPRLSAELTRAAPGSAEDEQALLSAALDRAEAPAPAPAPDPAPVPASEQARPGPSPAPKAAAPRPQPDTPCPGIEARYDPRAGRLELSGPGVTPDLHAELMGWLAARQG
ncbi:ParB/RepB/Spo0J family partition protein [Salipiger aestuarii]|uniref:ParB/RepB/Spo0J family partition protein n=1 Tax=Salipiger aestuarii TaxID=568098 RepID=UPI00123ADB2A|nr:ParB N-terminal domain-containing protein [Salipiger aestuarii]KAA8610018.1 hypothetical protein AL037_14280 [Salipiger aestuarii]